MLLAQRKGLTSRKHELTRLRLYNNGGIRTGGEGDSQNCKALRSVSQSFEKCSKKAPGIRKHLDSSPQAFSQSLDRERRTMVPSLSSTFPNITNCCSDPGYLPVADLLSTASSGSGVSNVFSFSLLVMAGGPTIRTRNSLLQSRCASYVAWACNLTFRRRCLWAKLLTLADLAGSAQSMNSGEVMSLKLPRRSIEEQNQLTHALIATCTG